MTWRPEQYPTYKILSHRKIKTSFSWEIARQLLRERLDSKNITSD